MNKYFLLLFMVFFVAGSTFAQRSISGNVVDDKGDPIIGANVYVLNDETSGTVTDLDGNYKLIVQDDAKVIIVKYVGYTESEQAIGVSNVMDFTIIEGVELESAIITALGITREEKAVGYSVESIGSDELTEGGSGDILQSLSGKAAGLQITSSTGAAGASSRIVLRGQTSFNGNNEALMIVDGVRIDNSERSSERSLQGVANSNRGIDINPNDIENVSILKGAAATALYGVEGARGVILITTKRGSKKGGGITVDVGSNVTFSKISQMVELQDKYSQGGTGTWFGPDGFDPVWWGGFVRALSWGADTDTLRYLKGSEYKWDKNGSIVGASHPDAGDPVKLYDNVDNFFKTGVAWNNNFAISGGTDVVNYRLSYGRLADSGVTPNNDFTRNNLGLSLGSRLLDGKLNINASAKYINSGGQRIQQGSNISGVMLGLLRTPSTFDNTNGLSDPADNPESYIFDDNSQRNYRGGGGYDNPFWIVNNTTFNDRVNRLLGSINLAYTVSPWVTLSTTIGSDVYSDNRVQRFEVGSRTAPGGRVIEDNYNFKSIDAYFNILGSGQLSEDFSINYNTGINVYDSRVKNNFTQGDGLNFYGFPELGNTVSSITTIDNNNQRNLGMFASVDFGYKNFAYLSLTGRNDWISTLVSPSKEFKAGDIDVFYPSVSFSFVFSELMKKNNILTYGKLRASYAAVGGGAPTSYLTDTYYFTANQPGTINTVGDGWTDGVLFPFNGTPGLGYSSVNGNPTLIPSKTTDLELGLDLRFLNNKVGLDVTVYNRKSKDQIIPIDVAASTGFQRIVFNSGELSTKGMEVILSLSPIRSKDFSWDVAFNFSTWKSKITSLPDGVPNQYLDGFEGSAIYNIAPDTVTGQQFEYGQIFGGAFQRVNDVDADGNPSFNVDKAYDPNGALIIDDAGSSDPNSDNYNPNYGFPMADPINRVIGNPNPDFLLGIQNTLNYKGIGLSFLFDIKKGGDMWNGTKGALTFFGKTQITEDRVPLIWNDNQGFVHDYANANHKFDGVLASDGSANNIDVPLDENWYTANGGGFGSVSEHFVEDASYYRLRYITLSYNFKNLLKGAGFSNLTFSLTGRNLLLFTPYTGVDPETSLVGSGSNGQGLDYFQLPGTKSYSFGLKATF